MKTFLDQDQRLSTDRFERIAFSTADSALKVPSRDMYRVNVNAVFDGLTPGEVLQLRVFQNDQLILQLIEFPLEEQEALSGGRTLDLRPDDEIFAEARHGGADDFSIVSGTAAESGGSTIDDETFLELEQIE